MINKKLKDKVLWYSMILAGTVLYLFGVKSKSLNQFYNRGEE